MKPILLVVSAADTVPAALRAAAAGSEPARVSDASAAAVTLASGLFFRCAGTNYPIPERNAGHISVLSFGRAVSGAGSAVAGDHHNGQRAFLIPGGGTADFVRQWGTGIPRRRRPERCGAAQWESRQGAMVCLRPKRRGLLHLLSIRGVHAPGRPASL